MKKKDKEIHFVDTSLRDGPQSIWNMGVTTGMMTAIAPTMGKIGFEAVDLIPFGLFGIERDWQENPWDRVHLVAQAMPNTPLMTGGVIRAFGNVSDSVIELWVKKVKEAGAPRIRINDPMHDMNQILKLIKWCKAAGAISMPALIFSISPYHTDKYYAGLAKQMAKAGCDRMFIKDVDGLLTPERVHTLVPTILKIIDGMPLELHSHCTTGLAPICYLEAIKLGIKTLHTAVRPVANGTSQPSIQNILSNSRHMGYTDNIDDKALQEMTEFFEYIAKREGFPMGVPLEYDVTQYEHQLPGGMASNYKHELGKRGLAHRLDDLLKEIALIRKELGYPVMVTPLSQYVGVQAVLNITGKERYATVTDEVIKFVLGHYGALAGPVDKDVLAKIMKLPRTKELKNWSTPQPSIKELRKEFGAHLSDEELILYAMSSTRQALEKLLASGPKVYDYPRGDKPELALIQELSRRKDLSYVHVQKGDFSLTLSA
jgi:oxaloacetate decarboxylase alpha subunit